MAAAPGESEAMSALLADVEGQIAALRAAESKRQARKAQEAAVAATKSSGGDAAAAAAAAGDAAAAPAGSEATAAVPLASLARRAAKRWRASGGTEARASVALQKVCQQSGLALDAAAEALKVRGNAALAAGDPATAVCWFEAGLGLRPGSHVLWSNQSAAFAQGGEYELALSSARNCVSANGSWARGHGREGLALFKLKRFEDAVEAYRRAVELDARNESLQASLREAEVANQAQEFNVLGEEQLARGKYAAAVDFLEKATVRDRSQRVYFTNLSEALYKSGRHAEALAAAEHAAGLEPQHVTAYLKRVQALIALERHDDAAAAYVHLAQLTGDSSYNRLMMTQRQEATRAHARAAIRTEQQQQQQ